MKNTDYIVVFVTTKDIAEAQQIADSLLEKRQAACVNIIRGVDSKFWWQNKIDSARESLLMVKSRAALLPEIIKTVKKTHSYTVPEIMALPIIGGNPDYLDWIDKETEPGIRR
jgi:periplasmic divalent cation tolerance protein